MVRKRLTSVENVTEIFEPALLSVVALPRVGGAARRVGTAPIRRRGLALVAVPGALLFELAPGKRQHFLELAAIEPDAPALGTNVHGDSISFAFVEYGSFTARAVHAFLRFRVSGPTRETPDCSHGIPRNAIAEVIK
jgi:hypothetical protein